MDATSYDVFVSYSRADRDTVILIVRGLEERGLRPWVDLDDIPPSAEWMSEIRGAIDAADGYLAVISPDLARSPVCAEELGRALEAGKRVVPVMVRTTSANDVPAPLAAINWIDGSTRDLDHAIETAVTALRTDLDHVKAHTRLQVRAGEWERKEEPRSLLLRGSDIAEAEELVASTAEPHATPVQSRFVQRSRAAATRRQRGIFAAVALALIVSLGLSALAFVQRQQAVENERIAAGRAAESRSRELAAAAVSQLDIDPERSVLVAQEAMASATTPEAVDALRQALGASRVRAVFRGHEGAVMSAGYDTSGERLITSGIDGKARIWHVDGSEEPIVLEGHRDIALAGRFSQDGSLAATASFDGTAQVWDASTGDRIAVLEPGGGAVWDVAFDAQGTAVATASGDGSVAVWDPRTGRRRLVLHGHTRPVYDVEFDPRGQVVASASDDDTARLWDAQTGDELEVLKGHEDGLYRVTFSLDGTHVATASEDGTAKIWNVRTGELETTVGTGSAPVLDIAFAPDGRRVVIASADETATTFDAGSGRRVAVLRGHEGVVNTVAFDPEGSLIVTSSDDGTARVWDAQTGDLVATLNGHAGEVVGASFAPDGTTVLTAGTDGTARVWDVATGRVVYRGNISWSFRDPSSDHIAVSTWDGDLTVISGDTGRVLWSERAPGPLTTSSFSGDGQLIASGSLDGTIRIYDARTGQVRRTLRGHDEAYVAADFWDQDSLLLSWSDDGTARLWDARTGEQLQVFHHGEPPEHGIWEGHLSSDGTRVFTTGYGDGIVRMWDAETGEQLWSKERLFQAGGIGGALSSDGRFAGTIASDAIIWDMTTGEQAAVLRSPAGIDGMVFSPDGSRVVTRSGDGVARIWNPATGELLLELEGHPGNVNSAMWDPSGRWVVTTADDGDTRVWDATTGELVATYGAGGGPGAFAYLSGDSLVVSQSESALRLDPCEACGSPQDLAGLAASRVTRPLTADERATMLGEEPPDVAHAPVARLTLDGQPVTEGALRPGTYRSEGFAPEVSFELAHDWFYTPGSELAPGETRTGSVFQFQPIDDPTSGLSIIALTPGRVVDSNKDWDEHAAVGPMPRDLGRWLMTNPYLRTNDDGPLVVDGLQGTSNTTEVTSVPNNPWPTCGGCVTALALTLQHDTGPLTSHDLINALGPGEIDRWIVLHSGSGTLLVNAYSSDQRGFERFWPKAQAILDSMEIED